MVSLGAGVFEELLFRVILVTVLMRFARVVFGAGPRASAAFAVIGSAVLFSAFHYIGPFGDTLALPSFLFRMISGLLFSIIYVLRGFGIVAWTHALYDVGLLLLGAGK
jgi:membrane protease YdiL (CAAX protease family)